MQATGTVRAAVKPIIDLEDEPSQIASNAVALIKCGCSTHVCFHNTPGTEEKHRRIFAILSSTFSNEVLITATTDGFRIRPLP